MTMLYTNVKVFFRKANKQLTICARTNYFNEGNNSNDKTLARMHQSYFRNHLSHNGYMVLHNHSDWIILRLIDIRFVLNGVTFRVSLIDSSLDYSMIKKMDLEAIYISQILRAVSERNYKWCGG